MKEVLSLQVVIFGLIAVGFLVKRIGIISDAGQKNINDLVIYVILPCNILKAFLNGNTEGKLNAYFTVLLISLGIQVFCVLYGKLMFRKETEGRRKCLEYATICSNAGFLGNPIAEGLYGAEGLVIASIYLIPQRIMMWSTGLPVFSGSHDWKKTVKKVVTHPCILACVLGIVFMLTGLKLPSGVNGIINALGSCNTAMSMLVIGMILERLKLKEMWDKTVLIYSLHRLIIIPGLIFLACLLLHIPPMIRSLCVLLAAMPAGATTSILAEKYQMEPEFATKLVIISTVLSLPTLFVWTMVLV
ncbi:MAG: AEC family transporter [Firmicutes bacterium]|nr:AEC family transporter [Bacillota bacterium]